MFKERTGVCPRRLHSVQGTSKKIERNRNEKSKWSTPFESRSSTECSFFGGSPRRAIEGIVEQLVAALCGLGDSSECSPYRRGTCLSALCNGHHYCSLLRHCCKSEHIRSEHIRTYHSEWSKWEAARRESTQCWNPPYIVPISSASKALLRIVPGLKLT